MIARTSSPWFDRVVGFREIEHKVPVPVLHLQQLLQLYLQGIQQKCVLSLSAAIPISRLVTAASDVKTIQVLAGHSTITLFVSPSLSTVLLANCFEQSTCFLIHVPVLTQLSYQSKRTLPRLFGIFAAQISHFACQL